MSWAWPVEKLEAPLVMDVDDFNSSVVSLAVELDGNIGEHNIDRTAFGNLVLVGDQYEDDIGMRIFVHRFAVGPHSAASGMLQIEKDTVWREVEGTADEDVICLAGELWVDISGQMFFGSLTDDSPSVQLCLGIDGQPQFDSLIGSGDLSNDYVMKPDSIGQDFDFAFAPGLVATQYPIALSGTYKVGPGVHRVSLFSRVMHAATVAFDYRVSEIEVITLAVP